MARRRENAMDKTSLSEEAYAYTPGLKVKRQTIIEKTKRLPLPGEVLVKKGQNVDFDTVVARTRTPGDPHLVNVAASLNVEPQDILEFMTKKEGENVKKGETIAQIRLLFGLVGNVSKSPVGGYMEKISSETGRVTIREPDRLVELRANLRGAVIGIIPNEGAVIRTTGAYVQGILGIGGETNGNLVMGVKSPDEVMEPSSVSSEHKGKILVMGAMITADGLRAALKHGVIGIIAGGIDYSDLTDFMGGPLGVAITGEEKLGLTLVITEGFGKMSVSKNTFEILKSLEGERIAMDGTTQIRAGVIRPEIIGPREGAEQEIFQSNIVSGMKPGTRVRIIQSPYFGKFGVVVSLPIPLKKIETESLVRVIEIELENGQRVTLPRANVEIIEE
jgi:hypothetical protein